MLNIFKSIILIILIILFFILDRHQSLIDKGVLLQSTRQQQKQQQQRINKLNLKFLFILRLPQTATRHLSVLKLPVTFINATL